MCALTSLEAICKKIMDGDVAIQELKAIENRTVPIAKLCEAAASSTQVHVPLMDTLSAYVKQRLAEYNHFQHYCKELRHLLKYLSSIQLEGMVTIE